MTSEGIAATRGYRVTSSGYLVTWFESKRVQLNPVEMIRGEVFDFLGVLR